MTTISYTSSKGKTVRFSSMAFLIDRFNQAHAMPEPPEYEIVTMGGAVEKHPHDETTLKTDEDRQAWHTYQVALAMATEKYARDLMNLILLECVQVDIPQDAGWEKRQERLYGMAIPTDPDERKLHYLTTEVLCTEDDYKQVALCAMQASGADEERIAQARALFRS